MKLKILVLNKVFPDELVLQILARLPIKSIFKFKSVCKLWYKLLSESYFINLYNQISIRNPKVLIEVSNSSKSKPNLFCADRLVGVTKIKLDFIRERVIIRASCNGLLLCSSMPHNGAYYVCNPMTRQYKAIPKIKEELLNSFSYPHGRAKFIGLVCNLFNRKFNVILLGFSWSVVSSSRKIVCLVYDSETYKWNKFNSVQEDFFIHMNIIQGMFINQNVYLNGSVYNMREGEDRIRFIDIKPDVFGLIPLPFEVRNEKGERAFLLELDGLLSVVHIADALLTFWVVRDKYIKKWEVVEKLSSRHIRGMIPHIYRISQSGGYMFFATHKKVVMYNRSSKVWRNLYSARGGCTLPLRFMDYTFRSTLVSLYD